MARRRIVTAMVKHETNTFSPIETPLSRFADWSLSYGDAAIAAYRGMAMPLAAYWEVLEAAGCEAVCPIAAEAMPSGPVTADAYREMNEPILDAVRRGCDGVMLDLHGAMVAETTDDGEGTLLADIRAIAPDLPIAVTCDLHCNLTRRMVENCTALIGYKTYPHVDMHAVAQRVAGVLMRTLDGEISPVMAWGQAPLLAQTLRMGTDDEPMKSLIAMARRMEAEGTLAATVFGGFPMADIADAGLSAVVVADGDRDAAQAAVDRLLAAAWERRADFVHVHRPLAETVAEAKTLSDGPIVLLDHADNCGSGATQDVMTVLAEVLAQGLGDVAVATVWDPRAVEEMAKAGPGAQVTLKLGGRSSMPSIGEQGRPLEVSGTVRAITDGAFTVRGPMYTGIVAQMGRTAVLDTGKVKIVVTSKHHEPWDLGVFTSVGIDPLAQRYLLLKSRIHYRAGFAPIAKATFTLDGDGVTTSDNARLTYAKLRRPIYPLDDI
jgi:microcystin degradation protein MlrC